MFIFDIVPFRFVLFQHVEREQVKKEQCLKSTFRKGTCTKGIASQICCAFLFLKSLTKFDIDSIETRIINNLKI